MGAWFEKALAASTITGWTLCALALLGLFGIWRIYALQRTKMRELDIGEDATIRSEYIAEMAALRAEITAFRDENRGLREEMKGLREENGELRKEVARLHQIIDGIRRETLTGQLAVQTVIAREMGDAIPPATRAALDSLDAVKGTGE